MSVDQYGRRSRAAPTPAIASAACSPVPIAMSQCGNRIGPTARVRDDDEVPVGVHALVAGIAQLCIDDQLQVALDHRETRVGVAVELLDRDRDGVRLDGAHAVVPSRTCSVFRSE